MPYSRYSPKYAELYHHPMHHSFTTTTSPPYAPYASTMTSHSLDDRDACLNQGYCHDSVYDALFLTLTPTQAIAGLTPTFTPTMPNHSWPIIYAYHLTHLYLSLLMANITENPTELIYHSYWLVIYSISTCTPIRLLIDSSLAYNYSDVLPIIPLSSHWTCRGSGL